MARTKRTPKNPQIHRPVTAIGKDIQPQGKISHKHQEKEENNPENLFHIRC